MRENSGNDYSWLAKTTGIYLTVHTRKGNYNSTFIETIDCNAELSSHKVRILPFNNQQNRKHTQMPFNKVVICGHE